MAPDEAAPVRPITQTSADRVTAAERTRLLFGPYRPPPLRKGELARCLLRDAEVVVTCWSAGRIPWPRCRALGSRGGSGLLLDDELARAVRHESAAAVGYWWGVTEGVVWRWRKALGVGRAEGEGSRRLIRAASRAGADAVKQRTFSEDELEARRRRALELNLARHLRPGYHGPRRTAEQLALVGVLPDAEAARRTGRSANAVRVRRGRLRRSR